MNDCVPLLSLVELFVSNFKKSLALVHLCVDLFIHYVVECSLGAVGGI